MKVFVTWDPTCEEVICVHTTRDGYCDKCFDPRNPNVKWNRYRVEEHEVVEDTGQLEPKPLC